MAKWESFQTIATFNRVSVSHIIGCSQTHIFTQDFAKVRSKFPNVILSVNNPEQDLFYYLESAFPQMEQVTVQLIGSNGIIEVTVKFNNWVPLNLSVLTVKKMELVAGMNILAVQSLLFKTVTHEAIQTKREEMLQYLIGKLYSGEVGKKAIEIADTTAFILGHNPFNGSSYYELTSWLGKHGIQVDLNEVVISD